MPNTNCLLGPAFSVIGDAYFSGTTVSFQVIFDVPEDESNVLAYEWRLDDKLMIDQNDGQFSGQLTCGEHTIGARVLSTTGWSGIKSLEFATCRTATELLFYGVNTINEGASTAYYILQLYSDGTSKDVTAEYIFTSLDRLDKKEITEALRIIRNTANFNNLVYFVAYDKNYVLEAVKSFNESNYMAFLEKIFQFEFALPLYVLRLCVRI